ncbi:hypothetical protein GCM10009790_33180 [Georgenia ruanii]
MTTWLDLHTIRSRDLICEARAARTRRLARRRPATRRPTR